LDAHAVDRYIVDDEFISRGGELDAIAVAFQGFLNRYLAIMDWVCAQSESPAMSQIAQTVSALHPFSTQFDGDGHYGTDCQNFINEIDSDDQWLYQTSGPVYRDFTDATEQRLLTMAKDLQSFWSQLFLGQEMMNDDELWTYGFRPSDVRTYDNMITTMNDATPDQITGIWSAVAGTDSGYGQGFADILTTLTAQVKAFEAAAAPLSKSDYQASTFGYSDFEGIFDNSAADPDLYGSDQGFYEENGGFGLASYDVNALIAVVEKDIPGCNEKGAKDILKLINRNGCPYAAMANSMLAKYAHDPAGFEEKFGFPLMVNGHYNYGALITDYFCYVYQNNPDIQSGDQSDAGVGLSTPQMGSTWQNYCQAKGISCETRGIDLTQENYKEQAEKGTITVTIFPVNGLYYPNGEYYPNGTNDVHDGHIMVITGVTADGKYIVSSWGQEFYLDPQDPCFKEAGASITFNQVTYD
jgi:hypothetical protein